MILRMVDELRIPTSVRTHANAVIDMTDATCRDRLDEEYGSLSL